MWGQVVRGQEATAAGSEGRTQGHQGSQSAVHPGTRLPCSSGDAGGGQVSAGAGGGGDGTPRERLQV